MYESKKILIVDDEPAILLSLSSCLMAHGVEVVTADEIEKAEELLLRTSFDLVIADIRMSGMYGIEGLELLSFIKAIKPDTAVIIMTGYGSDEIREEANRRGAYWFYEKPVHIEHLMGKVRDLGISVMSVA